MISTDHVPPEVILHSWSEIGVLRMRTALERRGYEPKIEKSRDHP
jgi:hypothetical protein